MIEIPTAQPTVRLETHGCKLNQADTQTLARQLATAGYSVVSEAEPADFYVLNSCTVTHVADRKARQAIRAARRQNPNGVIIVTGCYAQRAPDDLRHMPEIDLVVGNTGKPSLPSVIERLSGGPMTACAAGDDEFPTAVFSIRSRAMIKIQEGCDQVCAYCIVPKVRGRERSIPLDEIVRAVNEREAVGCKEVVLTGTQLGSYGFDLDGTDIRGLVDALLRRTTIPRIRISSLQPQDISDDLLDLWSDPRLCPHFHVPLQSGSDAILKRMRRRYTASEFLDAVHRIKCAIPGVGVTADAIVGFPGETDADFLRTVDVCPAAELASVHVFPYSIRDGTSAAYFDGQLDPRIKSQRVRLLSETADQMAREFRKCFIGDTRPVLWERTTPSDGETVWTGLTDNYLRVRTATTADLANRITPATIEALDGNTMTAHVVESDAHL